MKTAIRVALALGGIFLGAFAWWQHQRMVELERVLTRSMEEQDRLKRRSADQDRQLAALESLRVSNEAELRRLRRPAAPSATAPAPRADMRADMAKALDNPAAQQLLTTTFKASLDQRFGGLFRRLKLSSAELDRFKDLLAERQMSSFEVLRSAQSQGLNPVTDASGLAALINKAQADIDQSVRTLLGDQRFAQYEDFNQNAVSFGLLDQIEKRLSYTSEPLAPAQADGLLRVLIQSTPPPADNQRSAVMNFTQMLTGLSPTTTLLTQRPLSDEAIAGAQTVLTPAQLTTVRQIQAEQRSQAGALDALRGGAGSVPPGR